MPGIPLTVIFLIFFIQVPVFSGNRLDPIVMYRWKNNEIKQITYDFIPGEKIYAEYTFLPRDPETSVEFRWINPLNKVDQVYPRIVRSPMPPREQTVRCWLLMQPSLPDRILGSRYFGRWVLQVRVNSRLVATKQFTVAN